MPKATYPAANETTVALFGAENLPTFLSVTDCADGESVGVGDASTGAENGLAPGDADEGDVADDVVGSDEMSAVGTELRLVEAIDGEASELAQPTSRGAHISNDARRRNTRGAS